MTSPAEGLLAILAAETVVDGTTGWRGTIGSIQANTARQVCLLDHPGRGGEVKVAIDYPSVQAIIIGEKEAGGYSAAYAKAQEVYDTLQGVDTPHASWTYLVSCVALNLPGHLGKDEQDRPRFSLNFKLITTPENEGNRTY